MHIVTVLVLSFSGSIPFNHHVRFPIHILGFSIHTVNNLNYAIDKL